MIEMGLTHSTGHIASAPYTEEGESCLISCSVPDTNFGT